MSTLLGMNITVSGAVLNVQSNKVVVGYSNSNYIPSTPSGSYNWLERAADFEKLEAQKKQFMKVKEWLDYKKLEKVIEEKWAPNSGKYSKASGITGEFDESDSQKYSKAFGRGEEVDKLGTNMFYND